MSTQFICIPKNWEAENMYENAAGPFNDRESAVEWATNYLRQLETNAELHPDDAGTVERYDDSIALEDSDGEVRHEVLILPMLEGESETTKIELTEIERWATGKALERLYDSVELSPEIFDHGKRETDAGSFIDVILKVMSKIGETSEKTPNDLLR